MEEFLEKNIYDNCSDEVNEDEILLNNVDVDSLAEMAEEATKRVEEKISNEEDETMIQNVLSKHMKYNYFKNEPNLYASKMRLYSLPGFHDEESIEGFKELIYYGKNKSISFLRMMSINSHSLKWAKEAAMLYYEMLFHLKVTNLRICKVININELETLIRFNANLEDCLVIINLGEDTIESCLNDLSFDELRNTLDENNNVFAFIYNDKTPRSELLENIVEYGINIKCGVFSYEEKEALVIQKVKQYNYDAEPVFINKMANMQRENFYDLLDTLIQAAIKNKVLIGGYNPLFNTLDEQDWKYICQMKNHINMNNHINDEGIKLEELVGLLEVKKHIKSIENLVLYKRKQNKGIKSLPICMHMAFYGPPGVAKTTMARIIGKRFKEAGLLSRGGFYEIGREDLVGKYVGWTADKVVKKVREAKGSVLFIDEAYSLVNDSRDSFGNEALAALVKEMENNRDDTVVILAGYTDEMKKMISSNPGLKDRIAFNIEFPNYSADELFEIFMQMLDKKSLCIAEEVIDDIKSYFVELVKNIGPDFSNGRYVRKIIERIEMVFVDRLVDSGYEVVEKVTSKDINVVLHEADFRINTSAKIHSIGF